MQTVGLASLDRSTPIPFTIQLLQITDLLRQRRKAASFQKMQNVLIASKT